MLRISFIVFLARDLCSLLLLSFNKLILSAKHCLLFLHWEQKGGIFSVFLRRAEIPTNRTSPFGRASPPNVIGPLEIRRFLCLRTSKSIRKSTAKRLYRESHELKEVERTIARTFFQVIKGKGLNGLSCNF